MMDTSPLPKPVSHYYIGAIILYIGGKFKISYLYMERELGNYDSFANSLRLKVEESSSSLHSPKPQSLCVGGKLGIFRIFWNSLPSTLVEP
mgnify:CR=1 FL=1